MSGKALNQSQPLVPLFDFATAPDDVQLFHGEITLSWEDQSYTAEVDKIGRAHV